MLGFLMIVAFVAACVALSAAVLMWAWNAVMPPLLSLPGLGFWQAFAIMVLLGFIRSSVTVNQMKE